MFYNENLFAVFLDKSHICKNICSWDVSQIVLSQSEFLIIHISRTNQWINFLHVDTSLDKLKVDQEFFWLGMVMRLWNWLYLKNEEMEWTNILPDANSYCSVISVIIGWMWLEIGVAI